MAFGLHGGFFVSPLFQQVPRQGRNGAGTSYATFVAVANGGYGKHCKISSLVWLIRSTEFSILLLPATAISAAPQCSLRPVGNKH